MEYTEEEVLSLARRAYRSGDAAFPIEPGRTALLVIDMQDEFVRPGWTPFWVPEATRQVPRIRRLIDGCRALEIPVIFTVYSQTNRWLDRPKSGALMPNRNPELRRAHPEWFRDGRIWQELVPAESDIVIHKPSYGAFYDTPLETILRNLGCDTVIICGTLTNVCCGTTARQAYERGFLVVFGSDVNATNDPGVHESELRVLRAAFARVLESEAILAELAAAHQYASTSDSSVPSTSKTSA